VRHHVFTGTAVIMTSQHVLDTFLTARIVFRDHTFCENGGADSKCRCGWSPVEPNEEPRLLV
jgi:hypothetical protein